MSVATSLERFTFGREVMPAGVQLRVAPRPATMLLGRLLIASIFLLSGAAKVVDQSGTMAHMRDAGLPAVSVLLPLAIFAELAGGLSLALGFLTRIGALGLIVFLIPTSIAFHDFWNLSGAAAVPQMANFMKNVAIMGGLAFIIAAGPGRYSLDTKLSRRLAAPPPSAAS